MVTKMKKYFSKIFKYQSSVVYVFIFALVTILCVDSADIFWSTVKRITLEVGVKTEHYVFCGIGFVIILVILLRRKHFFDLIFKIKTVNLFDYIILYSFFSLLLMILALIVINQYYCYKIVFLVLSTVLLAILLLFRCKQFVGDNKNYISLLSELFSYVKRYSENKKLRDDNYSRDYDYKKTELFSRVNSTKFFELYMSYGRNAFLDNNVFFMDFTKKLDSSKQS